MQQVDGAWSKKLSLASLAVGADGLIVEVHHDPEHALSDGAQSLKPKKIPSNGSRIKKICLVY